MVVRHVDERLRLGVADGRPVDVDEPLEHVGEEVRDDVGGEHEEQEVGTPPDERDHEGDREPDGAERPQVREPDEDRVEDARPVVDDDALEVPVEPGQLTRRFGADHQDARAAAALALPLRGLAGFARDAACFCVRPSEMTGRRVLIQIDSVQNGAICFAWSISCWRSNGLPKKPLAPRLAASVIDRSST